MTDSEPAPMDQVGKKRTFTTITTTANALIKKCKNALEEDKLAVLLEGLEGATKEYLSIMLEKLDLPEIIEHEPKARALYNLDITGLFTLEKQEVEQAKVSGVNVIVELWYVGMNRIRGALLGTLSVGKSRSRVGASQTSGPKAGTWRKTGKNGPTRFF